jgi:hypothetical protein
VRKYRFGSRNAPFSASGYAVLYSSTRPEPMRPVALSRPLPVAGADLAKVRRARSRAQAAARRRLVLTVLLFALAVPLLLALATGSTGAWWAVVALLPVVFAYLAVMFRARRLSAEREINVAFFGGPQRGEFGLDDMFPAAYAQEPAELRAVSAGRY